MTLRPLSYSFLFLSFFVLFFSNVEGVSEQVQLLGFLLFSLAAGTSLIAGKVRSVPVGFVEVSLLLMIATSMFVNIILFTSSYSTLYTFAFSAVVICAMGLCRQLDRGSIYQTAAWAFVLAVVYILLTDLSNFISGISGELIYGVGLFRFRPFNLHPNLTGFVFGGGAVLLFSKSFGRSYFVRVAFLVSSCFCVLFIFASSSRASILALVTVIMFASLTRRQSLSWRGWVLVLLAAALLIVYVIYQYANFVVYFDRILDLSSSTRGVESGGTGRIDLWAQGAQFIDNSDLFTLLLGSGLRAANPEVIGFSTESSYVTILIESGILVGGFFLACLFAALGWILRICYGELDYDRTVVHLVLFAAVQSIFNRYLLAIGNPVSLLLILSFIFLSFDSLRLKRRSAYIHSL